MFSRKETDQFLLRDWAEQLKSNATTSMEVLLNYDPQVYEVTLFGSFARWLNQKQRVGKRNFSLDSDVDLFVRTSRQYTNKTDFKSYLKSLSHANQSATVQMVVDNNIQKDIHPFGPSKMRKEVARDGVVIYSYGNYSFPHF